MERIHTETIMSQFPAMAIHAMENGGMTFTEDGDYVDALDELLPSCNHLPIDVMNGDGDKGRIGLSCEDEMPEEELERLIAEQAADDAETTFVETDADEEEETDDKKKSLISKSKLRQESAMVAGREAVRFNGRGALERQGTRHMCSEHNAGRKPQYKKHFGPEALSLCTDRPRRMKTDQDWTH